MRKSIYLVVILLLFLPKISKAMDERELNFGFFVDRVIVSKSTILFCEPLNNKVDEIGNKIVQASERPDIKYAFRIINDPVVNAYAVSGGFIYVNTGLLDLLENKDELAAVLAHEIVHTAKGHQINNVYAMHNRMVAGQIGTTVFSTVLGIGGGLLASSSTNNTAAQGGLFLFAYQAGSVIGGVAGMAVTESMIKGYGRDKEMEADVLAIQYIKKAGYDPNAMISILKKLKSIRDSMGINEKNYISKFINAEPGLEKRIKKVEEFISNQNKK